MQNNYFPDQGHLFTFWKGRVALYTILKALGVGPGDEVILPAFTCIVVPNAILYLGATPVYADIEAETYNLSARTIAPLLTPRSRVIIAQNTFGLSADLEPIMALAQQHRLAVVEDCAHGLGGEYQGRPNGTLADAAFFSTQWSKPISTGLGGIAYTADEALAGQISALAGLMPRPSLGQQVMLGAQLLLRPLADQPRLHYPLIGAYRFLTQQLGVSVGSSTQTELESSTRPPGYTQRMSALQLKGWQRGLTRLEARVKRRQVVASAYDDFFAARGLERPYRPSYASHAMLRYTLRLPNRDRLLEQVRRLRIPLSDWFASPLYPVQGDLSRWGYQAGQCPVAEQACQEVVNLSTDRPLTKKQLLTLIDTIRGRSVVAKLKMESVEVRRG